MTTLIRSLIALLMLSYSVSTSAYPQYADDWSHRSVMYFAPTKDQHVQQFIKESLINQCELDDRDVVTVVVTQDGFTFPSWVKAYFDIEWLFDVYRVNSEEHVAILIGKDGTEKKRWNLKTDWQELSTLIDAMPLRKRETKGRVSPCKA
ncbi:DUF4174 domain-containing protein [Vibrio sp.]|uniref:DUF4174 domain-containing protein n=1 Tax=Vibrio sp. TaxID=678 RepID=UPI003D09D8AA